MSHISHNITFHRKLSSDKYQELPFNYRVMLLKFHLKNFIKIKGDCYNEIEDALNHITIHDSTDNINIEMINDISIIDMLKSQVDKIFDSIDISMYSHIIQPMLEGFIKTGITREMIREQYWKALTE